MKKRKCHFMETSVVYMEHWINSEWLHPTAGKVEAMVRTPIPKNMHELRFFVGLLNYYPKFLPNLASLLHIWTHCHSKNATGNGFQNALRLSRPPKILYFQQRYLPIMIHLIFKISSRCLSLWPGSCFLTYFSCWIGASYCFCLQNSHIQRANNAQIGKVALALVIWVLHFTQYLYGHTFTLVTDHKF